MFSLRASEESHCSINEVTCRKLCSKEESPVEPYYISESCRQNLSISYARMQVGAVIAFFSTIMSLLITSTEAFGFGYSQRIPRQNSARSLAMLLADKRFDALLFDCDGVIAETERDAHRPSFNEAFKGKGISAEWDVALYGQLLKIGGGKERMTKYFNDVGWPSGVTDESAKKELVQALHLAKTAKFQGVVESGVLPLRPGVARLVDDAFANGMKVAVCSTSNEAAVRTIVTKLLGPERAAKMRIFAGDVVEKKKPSPDVYLLAAKELGVETSRCWVVEDSEIGLTAGKAAGMRVVVTKSIYTREEDFRIADVIVDDLDKGLDGLVTISYLNYKSSTKAFNPASMTSSVQNAETFASKPDFGSMFKKIADGKTGSPFGM